MKKDLGKLMPRHVRALKDAIDGAAGWRGSLVGNYGDAKSIAEEEERLAEFDRPIALAREALAIIVKQMRKGKRA